MPNYVDNFDIIDAAGQTTNVLLQDRGTLALATQNSVNIGDLTELETFETDNLVDAINSIKLGYVNVKNFGAVGDGVTDDTQAIKDALTYARANNVKKVYVPSGIYLVSSTISIMSASNQNIHLCGAGFWSTIFRRAAGFTTNFFNSGDDGNGNAYGGMVCFSDFLIENGGNNPFVSCPSAYGIIMQTRGVLQNVMVSNGGNGFYCNGARVSFINCQYFADYNYTQLYQCNRGFHFDGHPYNIMMVNCSAEGQDPNANYPLSSGLVITGADGIQVDNCAFTGQIAIDMYANANNVDDVFFSNCIMDNGKLWNVRMRKAAGRVSNNIRFNGCHINNAGTDAIQCVGYDYVQFTNCNFQTAQGSMFALANNKDVIISNNVIDLGDQSEIATVASVLQDNGGNNGIVVNGNAFGTNNKGTYDIILSNSTNVIITNNIMKGSIYGTPAVNANNHVRT